jgi:hypothetical protein
VRRKQGEPRPINRRTQPKAPRVFAPGDPIVLDVYPVGVPVCVTAQFDGTTTRAYVDGRLTAQVRGCATIFGTTPTAAGAS